MAETLLLDAFSKSGATFFPLLFTSVIILSVFILICYVVKLEWKEQVMNAAPPQKKWRRKVYDELIFFSPLLFYVVQGHIQMHPDKWRHSPGLVFGTSVRTSTEGLSEMASWLDIPNS